MSLMTQSLKRIAEAQSRQPEQRATERPQVSPDPQSREAAKTARGEFVPELPHVAPEPAPAAPSGEQAARPADDVSGAASQSDAGPKPRYVPPAMVDLRTAILNEIGQPAADEDGKVVVLVSVQADKDTKAASAALTCALVGTGPRDVLSLDAAPPAATGAKKPSAGRLHGFTSLIDGTRNLEDVIVPAGTPGLAIIPSGLDKGSEQAFDPSAVERALADCRSRFAFTVVNGGPWQNNRLPCIAQSADAVYLVVRANFTEQEAAKQAVKLLDSMGLNVRGCILTGRPAS